MSYSWLAVGAVVGVGLAVAGSAMAVANAVDGPFLALEAEAVAKGNFDSAKIIGYIADNTVVYADIGWAWAVGEYYACRVGSGGSSTGCVISLVRKAYTKWG